MSLNHLFATAEPKLDLTVKDLTIEGVLTQSGGAPSDFTDITFSNSLESVGGGFTVNGVGAAEMISARAVTVTCNQVQEYNTGSGLNLVGSGVVGVTTFGAFYPEKKTTAEITALSEATYIGAMFYDSTTNQMRYSNGTTWVAFP